MATDGKKVRVRVQTTQAVYIGDVLLPAMRNRVSDYFNDEIGRASCRERV